MLLYTTSEEKTRIDVAWLSAILVICYRHILTMGDERRGIDVAKLADSMPPTVSVEDVDAIRAYKIPRVTEDGTCSMPNDLEPEPFQLLQVVYGIPSSVSSSELVANPVVKRLATLKKVVATIAEVTHCEWVGVYRVIDAPDGSGRVLVKEAYVGAPSRPFFPLTQEFAKHSNNSTVAMTSQTVIIQDVSKMNPDEPYYTCDGKVQSELCAPIIDASGVCIGIIDAEAWRPNHFTEGCTSTILDVCKQLGELNLLR